MCIRDSNPSAPKLNFLIKLHNVDKPITLINARTSPNYKISKLQSQILKHKIKLQAKYNIYSRQYRTRGTTKKHASKQKYQISLYSLLYAQIYCKY